MGPSGATLTYLSEGQWRQLARNYLEEMGFGRNQYLLVRHTDTPSHEHVHIVLNRVGLNGKAVSDSWDYVRAQRVVHQLEAQYGLSHAPLRRQKQRPQTSKASPQPLWSEPTIESLPSAVQAQVGWQRQLRRQVNGALMTAGDLSSFTQQLAEQGIVLKLLYHLQIPAGASFEWQGQKMAGSRLGQAYSLPKLLLVLDDMAAPLNSRPSDLVYAADFPELRHHDGEAEAEQLEPDQALSPAHQRYGQLEALVQQQTRMQLTRQQIDLKIAQWVLRSSRPEDARALVYSPACQRLRVQQSNAAALDYLKALMAEAQQQLGAAAPDERQPRPTLER